ncbi:anthranilate phosphoribosyltransferase [Hirschia litorea]|uniref:Anthranilate phosphoribosyltransferase n=1 Tax=Hirschia litorea TaxID=1199156 RepID=A0ABW2IHU7_9PROT
MSDCVKQAISLLADSKTPKQPLIRDCFDAILSGSVDPILISAFLMGLRIKGESVDDIQAASETMRAHSIQVSAPEDVVDTCGTGGLPFISLNTSTASALVIAGAGGRVAKHGNRSVPPKTGSADVLEALGVKLDITKDQFQNCLEHAGVGFMFARAHHSAMRHVAPVRQTLGLRTIFNLLGPLTNPANAKFQIIGVFDKKWLNPLAVTLQRLGTQKAWIVHGDDGLDEISISGETHAVEVTPKSITPFTIIPENLGISRSSLEDLKGGNAEFNATAITDLLNGKHSAFRDIVAINAGAGLYMSNKANSHPEGVKLAFAAIDDGRAKTALQTLVKYSNLGS